MLILRYIPILVFFITKAEKNKDINEVGNQGSNGPENTIVYEISKYKSPGLNFMGYDAWRSEFCATRLQRIFEASVKKTM